MADSHLCSHSSCYRFGADAFTTAVPAGCCLHCAGSVSVRCCVEPLTHGTEPSTETAGGNAKVLRYNAKAAASNHMQRKILNQENCSIFSYKLFYYKSEGSEENMLKQEHRHVITLWALLSSWITGFSPVRMSRNAAWRGVMGYREVIFWHCRETNLRLQMDWAWSFLSWR